MAMVVVAHLVVLIGVVVTIAYHKNVLEKMEKAETVANDTVSGEDENSVRKVFIPDNADVNDAKTESTQNKDCKTFTVDTNQNVEKTVVGSSTDEENDDDPIKNI